MIRALHSKATRVSWVFRCALGTGRTIEQATEAALEGVPAPFTFEILRMEGSVSAEKELTYSVRVKAVWSVTESDESAEVVS